MRRGMSLVEVSVALVVLAVGLAGFVQMLTTSRLVQRSAVLEAAALREADNALERLLARDWDALTPEFVAGHAPDMTSVLPDGRLAARLDAIDGPLPGKRVTVEVTWRRPGIDAPVRLVGWKFRSPGATP